MSWRVRDYIANRTRRSRKVLPTAELDPDLIGCHLALADATETARADLPDEFAVADALLAVPNREPQTIVPFDPAPQLMAECRWCGEVFVVFGGAGRHLHCSRECRLEHQRFEKGRA